LISISPALIAEVIKWAIKQIIKKAKKWRKNKQTKIDNKDAEKIIKIVLKIHNVNEKTNVKIVFPKNCDDTLEIEITIDNKTNNEKEDKKDE
jgi:hypothetical protein